MFNNPCKCCGSNEHALLRIITDDKTQIEFECPVIHHKGVEDMLKVEQKDMMYKPCPERFACLYGYHEETAVNALRLLDSDGAGKYWGGLQYREFKEKTIEACLNYSRQNTFKRDQYLECYYAGEVEFRQDEDDEPVIDA